LNGLSEIHTLWIGSRLKWMELLSLHSWLAHGHRVTLWCYDPIEGVPDAVCTADAAEILPKTSITRHRKTGSVALFANRFRYHLLQRGPVTWLDLDILLLRPLGHTPPYLFGWESPTLICNAVMRLPPESAVLQGLIQLTGAHVPVPRWWGRKRKLKQRIKGLIGRHERVEDMEWGTFGPVALTYFLLKRDLARHALPIETFYPIYWTEVSRFFATPDAVSSRLTEKTNGVHLWSKAIQNDLCLPDGQNRRNALPSANSWLGAMCKRYGVEADVAVSPPRVAAV
jgi:Alpha 1,4-glycosyltransferase conserved region